MLTVVPSTVLSPPGARLSEPSSSFTLSFHGLFPGHHLSVAGFVRFFLLFLILSFRPCHLLYQPQEVRKKEDCKDASENNQGNACLFVHKRLFCFPYPYKKCDEQDSDDNVFSHKEFKSSRVQCYAMNDRYIHHTSSTIPICVSCPSTPPMMVAQKSFQSQFRQVH